MRTLMLAILFGVMTAVPAWAQHTSLYDDRPKITVNGEAVVYVKPDKIVISLGIETWDGDMGVAKRKNNDILRKALAAITACGVPEKEIQTDHLSIAPRWKDEYRKGDFIGYFVRNTLVVNLTEAEKVEELATRTLEAGVTHLHGIDFQTTDFKKHRERARELALKAAKEKAEKMASVLGQSVGAPLQIAEGYSGSPWRYYSSWGGWGSGRYEGMSQNVAQEVRGGSGEMSDTIVLGKIAIRAGVAVTFELKK
jgi:uncharacterized protein YggE